MSNNLVDQLDDCGIGTRIWFTGEKKPYYVRATSSRYLVCTKPFNLKHTVMYTIVDLEVGIRGAEGVVFELGAETETECFDMLDRLLNEETQVSRRNRVPLQIDRVDVCIQYL